MTSNSLVSRSLAVGVLATLILGAWLGIVAPAIGAFRAINERNGSLVDQLGKYQRTASRLQQIEQDAQTLQTALAAAGLTFDEPSIDVAAARLQKLITELVRSNQGQMRTAQRKDIPPSAEAPTIAVHISFATSNVGLVSILSQLEGLRPAVFVGSLAIRSAQPLGSPAANGNDGPFLEDAILNVDLQANAYVRSEALP